MAAVALRVAVQAGADKVKHKARCAGGGGSRFCSTFWMWRSWSAEAGVEARREGALSAGLTRFPRTGSRPPPESGFQSARNSEKFRARDPAALEKQPHCETLNVRIDFAEKVKTHEDSGQGVVAAANFVKITLRGPLAHEDHDASAAIKRRNRQQIKSPQ